MSNTYAYLFGITGLGGIVFCFLCFVRKDLRKIMLYGGTVYLLYMTACFFLLKLLSSDAAKTINPGYWSPPSLFDLNRKTGGLGIEDVVFMFLVGAVAAGFYEVIFKVKVSNKTNKKLRKGHALAIGVLAGSLVYVLTPLNAIYFTIIVQLVGAIALVWRRHDLLRHALNGGLLFMVLYISFFLIFNLIFPGFLNSYYHLQRTSHVWLAGLPLEEYLYSFTLGLIWAPIYEYEFRRKDTKRRWLGPRRVYPAVGGARR